MITSETEKVEHRIIEAFENYFVCAHGPSMYFFELPQRDGDPVRVTYVVYAISGENLADMERWFFERVVIPMKNLAGEGGYLYWRNPERVSVETRSDSRLTIYTRIAVLNKSLDEIRIKDAIK